MTLRPAEREDVEFFQRATNDPAAWCRGEYHDVLRYGPLREKWDSDR